MIPLFVGFDPREAAAYHVFCQSIISNTKQPVSITPLHRPMLNGFDGQRDGTNAFIFSRFLVPSLTGFQGWAMFADGDMVLQRDLGELWALRDESKAVMVVKHDYKTKQPRKYVGTPLENANVDYPRKNWSSVILWNCAHPGNRWMRPSSIEKAEGSFLHRFSWLTDDEIGSLPAEWNWLDIEQPRNESAALIHYTLGVPGFPHYAGSPHAKPWHDALREATHLEC